MDSGQNNKSKGRMQTPSLRDTVLPSSKDWEKLWKQEGGSGAARKSTPARPAAMPSPATGLEGVKLEDIGALPRFEVTDVAPGEKISHELVDLELDGLGIDIPAMNAAFIDGELGNEELVVLMDEMIRLLDQEIALAVQQQAIDPDEADDALLADSENRMLSIRKDAMDFRNRLEVLRSGALHLGKGALAAFITHGAHLLSEVKYVVSENRKTIAQTVAFDAMNPVESALQKAGIGFIMVEAAEKAAEYISPQSRKLGEYAQDFRMVLGAVTWGKTLEQFMPFALFQEEASERALEEVMWLPNLTPQQRQAYVEKKVRERYEMLQQAVLDVQSGKKDIGSIYEEIFNKRADKILKGEPAMAAGRQQDTANLMQGVEKILVGGKDNGLEKLVEYFATEMEPTFTRFASEDATSIAPPPRRPPTIYDDLPPEPNVDPLDKIASLSARYNSILQSRQRSAGLGANY